MKNVKLNQIIFTLAGLCAFVGLANVLAIAEGVNAPQNGAEWLVRAAVLAVVGVAVRRIGIIARSR